jgi:hypothetical protein
VDFLDVGVLVLVAALVAGAELVIRGRAANRWREYLLVIGGGVLGASIGTLIDLITSRISPEYFTIGKGLGFGPNLEIAAALVGARAGFTAGVALTGSALVAAGPGARIGSGGTARLAAGCLVVALVSIASAAILGLFGGWLQLRPAFLPMFFGGSQVERSRFVTVWWTHLGVYVGLLVGGVCLVWRAWRWRQEAYRRAT